MLTKVEDQGFSVRAREREREFGKKKKGAVGFSLDLRKEKKKIKKKKKIGLFVVLVAFNKIKTKKDNKGSEWGRLGRERQRENERSIWSI